MQHWLKHMGLITGIIYLTACSSNSIPNDPRQTDTATSWLTFNNSKPTVRQSAQPYEKTMKIASLAEQTDNPQIAIKAYQTAIRMAPHDPKPVLHLGLIYLKHRQPQAALDLYQQGIHRKIPASVVDYPMGLAYLLLGDLPKASTHFLSALKQPKHRGRAYRALAVLLEKNQTPDLAKQCAQAGDAHLKPTLTHQNAAKRLLWPEKRFLKPLTDAEITALKKACQV